ncbi:transcription factor FAMA isoform X2 [Carica papaya]|uniref:transcription factor FAMA isoform X2 n=1 Tax=Carica papaya TaxID=3649 RepID=UPI000B8D0A74|nr:transcription factor FAMA isoform X2 [Carica papaya]
MEKEETYSASFTGLVDYSLDHNNQQLHHHHHHHQQQQFIKPQIIGETSGDHNDGGMIDYMLMNNLHTQQQQQQQQQQLSHGFCTSISFDKLSFADVMQFADFGPKLGLSPTKVPEEETGIDPVYFLKFPVLNDKLENHQLLMAAGPSGGDTEENKFKGAGSTGNRAGVVLLPHEDNKEGREDQEEEARVSKKNSVQQLQFLGDQDHDNIQNKNTVNEGKNKRKRPRTIKTSEEVESQRMTHIAVERNRRKQMNEHLRVLRSLMPGSYVQRGDQASIIGGAIEFVRELEQLLQCLESQKRRRLLGEAQVRQMGDSSSMTGVQQPPLIFPAPLPQLPTDQIFDAGIREETAENKSCLADVEVKVLGFDAMIKILSRRRPGQLIKIIAALEDLQLNILHTNITTIEQTVLYSFNVKVGSETRFTAEDIASSVQQIFSFIHANSGM